MSQSTVAVDLLPFANREYQENPYPYYKVVRDLTPLYESPMGIYAVPRHSDVFSLLRDKRLSAAELDFGVANIFHDSVLGTDSPDHGRLRRISAKWFTPDRISEWIVETRRIVDKALDEGAVAGGLDACQDISFSATFGTMAYVLGVGTHDAAECRQKVIDMGRALRPAATEADVTCAQEAFAWYVDYITDLVAFKRKNPGNSLLDAFLAAQGAGEMSEAEIMATVTLFYAVGHLDNSFLIQNGIKLLAEMPQERELFRSSPEIRNDMISEMLRIDTPEQFVTRVALEDIDISGETLPAGGIVLGLIGSANMDDKVFANPEKFDFTRPDLTRLQMAFGAGQHGCHGQLLARAQAECAIGALVERFPDYRVSGPVTHEHTEFIRNISMLPIEFH
jgi:cytochrome P450